MNRDARQNGVENLARIGTALSSPVRLEFLELLAQGERSVEQLARLAGVTVANTSQHLQKLKAALVRRVGDPIELDLFTAVPA